MKKYEKALLAIFGFCAVLSVSAVLYIWYGLDKGTGYVDDGITVVPFWCVFVSLAGLSAVLISWRLRKRAEAGKKPVSGLYTLSFVLSFLPFVLLIISSVNSMSEGFSFMGDTWYGTEAFWDTFSWNGILVFSCLVPVFPAMIFWQILYIIKRKQYRKLMRASGK
ncbi:hypothetical protein [Ruminococcus sp.]|uniref:hypothetical protein n=1 Tax=Ruminococcus sp. TaxID=41978 RepID=UPI0025FEB3DD|nr:hypothetical protein [Ruminococcus sp.]MBQ6251693.1 hypothetical protein [Ruminococcus sp.]